MPRTKKYVAGIQPVTNDDLEEQLLRTVIIHPDSRYIRMCRPNDREAVLLPHCIARRQKQSQPHGFTDSTTPKHPPLPESFRSLHPNASNKEFKAAVAAAETWLKENCDEEKVSGRPYCSFDAKEIEDNPPAVKEYYIGNEALDVVAINANYMLSWPLKYGRFDVRADANGSRTAIAASIEHIWDKILTDELGIPRSSRSNHRAVLVIPDLYNRDDVRDLVNVLLCLLDFSAVFIAIQSVASAFGASLASACVVDVGAEKIVISCVDEGLSIPETRILLHYGGDDITRLSHWYLQQKLRAFTLELNTYADWFKMEAIKKAICHYDLALQGSLDLVVNLPSPDREETVHIKMPHDFARFPGLVLFFPGLLAPMNTAELVEFHKVYDGASDDLYGAWNKHSKFAKKEIVLHGDVENLPQNEAEESKGEPFPDRPFSLPAKPHVSKFMELHAAIVWSIARCCSEEQQKRMLRSILVVGGGFALFPGCQSLLRTKLEELVPSTLEMCIVSNSREVPADLHALKGASIMAALETVQFLWITKEEWNRFGTKVLREKASFAW